MEMTGPIIIGIVFAVAFAIFVIIAIIRGQKRRLSAGAEDMIGKVAQTQTALNPKGRVLAEGELWTAIAQDSKIESGEEVTITKVKGLTLWVKKREKEDE
jgi:membrane-bound serine protease (ClpP class)